jgi:hypothetical protein
MDFILHLRHEDEFQTINMSGLNEADVATQFCQFNKAGYWELQGIMSGFGEQQPDKCYVISYELRDKEGVLVVENDSYLSFAQHPHSAVMRMMNEWKPDLMKYTLTITEVFEKV